jgi:hypothetical protein
MVLKLYPMSTSTGNWNSRGGLRRFFGGFSDFGILEENVDRKAKKCSSVV